MESRYTRVIGGEKDVEEVVRSGKTVAIQIRVSPAIDAILPVLLRSEGSIPLDRAARVTCLK